MPRQVFSSHIQEQVSIIEYKLDDGEDMFLTYSWGRESGPEIHRTGKGPPYVELFGGEPGQTTTHAFGLRLGSWLIRSHMRVDELKEAERELTWAKQNGLPPEDIAMLERTVEELKTIPAHDEMFQNAYPQHEITGQQGCGDLTMNEWSVAYVNNDLADGKPRFLHLPQEPLEYRIYSCLVKWRAHRGMSHSFNIEEVRFKRKRSARTPNEMVWVRFDNQWYPRGDWIDFAVSSQQVIRDGKIMPVAVTCHQFGDLRHLIQLPNLNPSQALYLGEPIRSTGSYRPRQYFGKDQHGDIWLGEEALLRDTSQNLLRASLSGPVYLDFPPDSNERTLRGALTREGYQEAASAPEPLSPGTWRFIRRGPQVTLIEIYFKPNTYAWTMIGLSQDKRRILCLGCIGKAGQTGYTLERAANFLLQAGAHNALLIDEGWDVFQTMRSEDGHLKDIIPPKRRRLRATFVFARQPGTESESGKPIDGESR